MSHRESYGVDLMTNGIGEQIEGLVLGKRLLSLSQVLIRDITMSNELLLEGNHLMIGIGR